MDKELIDLSKYRIQKALDDLETATLLINNGKYMQCLNRSYYSMFHGVRALLALDKFDSKKHSGVIAYFNQTYIKTGKIESKYGKMLVNAEKIRIRSDYDDFYIASRDVAEKQLAEAKAFIEKLQEYLNALY